MCHGAWFYTAELPAIILDRYWTQVNGPDRSQIHAFCTRISYSYIVLIMYLKGAIWMKCLDVRSLLLTGKVVGPTKTFSQIRNNCVNWGKTDVALCPIKSCWTIHSVVLHRRTMKSVLVLLDFGSSTSLQPPSPSWCLQVFNIITSPRRTYPARRRGRWKIPAKMFSGKWGSRGNWIRGLMM